MATVQHRFWHILILDLNRVQRCSMDKVWSQALSMHELSHSQLT